MDNNNKIDNNTKNENNMESNANTKNADNTGSDDSIKINAEAEKKPRVEIEDLNLVIPETQIDFKVDLKDNVETISEPEMIDDTEPTSESDFSDESINLEEPNDIRDNTNDIDDLDSEDEEIRDSYSNADELKEQNNSNAENTQGSSEQVANSQEEGNSGSGNKRETLKDKKENIKNKANDAKNKVNETKDKAKNAWQNRPKNMGDMKNRMQGANLKERLKNGAKNTAKKAANNMKNNASDSFKNSGVGQKLDKAKNAFDKGKNAINKTKNAINKGKKAAKAAKKAAKVAVKAAKVAAKVAVKAVSGLIKLFVSTLPYSAIVVGVILLIILIVVLIVTLVPGVGGDVNDDEAYSQYSEVDRKTLTKVKKYIDQYPHADGTLAMSIVLYPYFDNLHSGNTISYLTTNDTGEEEEIVEEEVVEEEEYDEEDYEDVEDAEEDATPNDPYLVPLRKSKIRRRMKKVLKQLSSSSEDDFKTYLKETYFTSDNGYSAFDDEIANGYNGYKDMLKNVSDEDKEAFLNSVIEDIYDNKDFFINYIYEVYSCSTVLHTAGTVDINEMLKSNILVDVKVPSCKTGTGVWDCQSVYPNPITLKDYVFGAAYEEFNSMDVEKTAAQMLATKSYVVQRGKSQGWGVRQDQNGNYVVTIRNNTIDSTYCDVNLGCASGNTMIGDGNTKRNPISEEQRAIYEQAWAKVADKFIYDKNSGKTVGAYCQTRSGGCNSCKKGSCLSHEELKRYTNTPYESIIAMQYSNHSIIQIEGDFANVTIPGETDCTGTANIDIDDSNFVYYAQSDYPNVAFCGRTLSGSGDGLCSPGSSICTSGCGLVSMTMVAATLTQNYAINPITLNSEVRVGTDCGPGIEGTVGGNMFPYISQKYGLTISSKAVSSNAINDIKKGLDEGGLIIASVCGGLKSNMRYTNGSCGGHFIVVRGYEGDSVIISDPYQNSSLRSYKNCLTKKNGKCIKHKMDFNTFQSDLQTKGGTLHIIKGKIPFSELRNQGQNKEQEA